MAKSYSGLDKTESFFAHYGRKGMKRGMNIFNPDYKPVGEKAKFTNEAVPAKKSSGFYKAPLAKVERKALSAPTTASKEAAAKERAFRSSQQYAVETRREKLMNAERQRQAEMVEERYGNTEKKKKQTIATLQKEFTKGFVDEFIANTKETGMYDEGLYNDHKKMWDAMTPTERAYNMKMIAELAYAKGGAEGDISSITQNFGTDNEPWALMSSTLAVAAGKDGYSNIIDHALRVAQVSGDTKQVTSAIRAGKTNDELTARKSKMNRNKEYQREVEYNSKKNGW